MSGSAFDVSVIRRDDGSEVLSYNRTAVLALQQEATARAKETLQSASKLAARHDNRERC